MPARSVLKPVYGDPVLGQRNGGPGGHRRQFFLADVVGEAAAIGTDAAAENERVLGGAVDQVVVVPVIDAGPDDDRAFALGQLGGVGPFTGEAQHVIAGQAGVFLLPGWRVDRGFIVVIFRVGARQAAIHAELRHEQVVDGRHDGGAAIRKLDAPDGHATEERLAIGEIIKLHQLGGLIKKRQGGRNRAVVLAILEQQVPLTLLRAPAMAHGALGHLGRA